MENLESKKVQLGMSGVFLFTLMSMSILSVVLPIYMRTLNYTDTQIGFMIGSTSFISIFSSFIWGVADDKTKKTQLLLRIVFIGLIFCSILLGVVKQFSIFLLVRMAMQIFNGGYGLLAEKAAIQMEVHYNIPYNHVRIFGSLGYATVLLPVIYLVERFNNYQIIFVAMALFFVLALVSTRLLNPLNKLAEADASEQQEISIISGIKTVIKTPAFILVAIIYTVFFTMLDINTAFQGIHIVETLGAPTMAVSWSVFIASGLSEVPFMYMGPKIQKKIGWFSCVLVSVVALLITFLLESVTTSWQMFLVIKLLHGANVALMFGPILMLVRRHIPSEMFSTTVSLLTALRGISIAVVSPIVGNIIERGGSTFSGYPIYIGGLVVTLLTMGIYYQQVEKNRVKEAVLE